MENSGSASRYRFGIYNLPLQEHEILDFGGLTISPIREGQVELNAQSPSSRTPILSAVAERIVPPDIDPYNAREFLESQPVDELELLLSFAHRCSIRTTAQHIETPRDGAWIVSDSIGAVSRIGKPKGTPWFFTHDELQAYLNESLPVLLDEVRGIRTGLAQALRFHCTHYYDDFMESKYLKSFIALEILFSSHSLGNTIVTKEAFIPIKKAVQRFLEFLDQHGDLTTDNRKLMGEKIAEINRLTARRQALRLFQDVFANYPEQRVTDQDMRHFLSIRNDITHNGIVQPRTHGETAYAEYLHLHHRRLVALLDRVILAMLGQSPHLMEFAWTAIRFQR